MDVQTIVQEKPSALQRNLLTFSIFWVIFALLGQDTDPGIPLNPDTVQDLHPHTVKNAGNFTCTCFQPL